MGLEVCQGSQERRPVLDGIDGAHTSVNAPSGDGHPLAGGPRLDRCALRVEGELLLILARPDVSNRHLARPDFDALAHALSVTLRSKRVNEATQCLTLHAYASRGTMLDHATQEKAADDRRERRNDHNPRTDRDAHAPCRPGDAALCADCRCRGAGERSHTRCLAARARRVRSRARWQGQAMTPGVVPSPPPATTWGRRAQQRTLGEAGPIGARSHIAGRALQRQAETARRGAVCTLRVH